MPAELWRCEWHYGACSCSCWTTYGIQSSNWHTISRKREQFSLPRSYGLSQAGKSFIWRKRFGDSTGCESTTYSPTEAVLNYLPAGIHLNLTISSWLLIIYYVVCTTQRIMIFHIHIASPSTWYTSIMSIEVTDMCEFNCNWISWHAHTCAFHALRWQNPFLRCVSHFFISISSFPFLISHVLVPTSSSAQSETEVIQTKIVVQSTYTSAITRSLLKWNGRDCDGSMHYAIELYCCHVTTFWNLIGTANFRAALLACMMLLCRSHC